MACGLPAIAVDRFGPADIVDAGETGWLVEPDDEAGLAAALAEAIDRPGERAERGALARERALARYSWPALAERIARVLGDALVAPVIAYVPEGGLQPATGHMRFPGTITVPEDVFRRGLESAAQSFRLHGFRDIVFLGDHGSTQATQKAVAARLNREWRAGPVRAHAIEAYYRAATLEFRELLRARGYRPEELGDHAALPDTALTLALDPRLVRASPPRDDDRLPGAGTGVEGDPRRASAELGRLGVELIVARTVAAIKASTTQR
jgi:creatinine amidohydrolase/Fe(II)-dependent formamide hydrolase-like protein